MMKIGFIGAYDKIDLLLNVAKVLTVMNYRVLLVDATTNEKTRYIVPAINTIGSYITSFEDIDVAIGFDSIESIKNNIGTFGGFQYDIVLIDCDNTEKMESFQIETSDINYFVTAFDLYSLKKGIQILNNLESPIDLTKILFTRDVSKESDEYLEYISSEYKINWNNDKIYFPIENGDFSVAAENQRVQKIKLKKFSVQYKDGLSYIVQQILNQENDSNIRKMIKSIERGL